VSEGLLDSTLKAIDPPPVSISADILAKIAKHAAPSRFDRFIQPLEKTFARYQIGTRLRRAHFLAQLMHESGEFWFLEELADGSAYENRRDLGNTQPGDGRRYKGRGLIQLTGRANYVAYSKAAGVDFVANPETLKEPRHAVDVSGWFWDSRSLNALADADDAIAITKRINGGTNGLAERQMYLERAKKALA